MRLHFILRFDHFAVVSWVFGPKGLSFSVTNVLAVPLSASGHEGGPRGTGASVAGMAQWRTTRLEAGVVQPPGIHLQGRTTHFPSENSGVTAMLQVAFEVQGVLSTH